MREYYENPDGEYMKKLRQRAQNVKTMSNDPLARARMVLDVYSVDFERFCEDFLFLIIPEYGDAIKPFFMFEYQKRIVRKIADAEMSGEDMELLCDKPRGMGLTWLIVAYFYWRWLYTPNWSAFVLSRTETEVDDGSAIPNNSIFGKLRWLIAHTPKWMLPDGFEAKGKKGNSTDSTLRLINPAMNSSIVGSSTNSNAGRSRRYSIILIDECFSIEHFNDVYRALQSVSRVKLFISTTKAGAVYRGFKDLCEKAGNYISLVWKDHPWKDQEWYEEQLVKAEFDPEVMKEIDVSYAVNPKMQYYPQVSMAKIESIEYDPQKPIYTGLDFGSGDVTVIVYAQFTGNSLNIIDVYHNSGKGDCKWYAPFLNPEIKDSDFLYSYNPVQLDFIAKVRRWRKATANFGEVAHTIKSMADNRSISDVLGKLGIRIMVNTYAIEYEPRRLATSQMLPKTVFNKDSAGAMELYDAITNSRKMSVDNGNPKHDGEVGDYRSAFENLCANIGRIFKNQRGDIGGGLNDGGFVSALIRNLKV